jgi:hypothetical protein
MTLPVAPPLVPALEAALVAERDAYLACLADGDALHAQDDIRCLGLVAGWLVEMPRLRIRDDEAWALLASMLDERVAVAMADGRYADARDLLSVRVDLQPVG